MRSSKKHNILFVIILIGIISTIGGLFSSCKTNTVYIPVETIRTEYKDILLRDSIFLQDSILTKMKGDTIWIERYRYLYRDKLVRDSIFTNDSIQVAYPVKGDTEYINQLYWWQYLLMALGAICVGGVGYRIYSGIKSKINIWKVF